MSSSNKLVSNKIKVLLCVLSVMVLTLIALAFVLFINFERNKKEVFFDSGSVVMTYAENSDIFFLNNMLPISNDVGRINNDEGQFYDFTVKVNLGNSESIEYEIALEIDKEFTTALPENVIVYLEKQESGSYVPVIEPTALDKLSDKSFFGAPSQAKIITNVSNKESVSHNYRLRMWLSDGTIISPDFLQSFGIEINIYAKAK